MAFIPAIDVSQYQGVIDWSQISEPIAMLKISGGDNGLYYDSQATRNYYGAKRAGKAVGGYHFAGATNPISEADFFLRGMMPFVENDVMALDWEVNSPNPVDWCLQFVQHVHDKCGVWPLLYINLSTLNAHDWSPVLKNCGLWIADWNNNPDGVIDTTEEYVMQQYNNGPWCDHDAWFGTLDEFKKYGWHAPVPVVSPVEPPTPSVQPPTVTITPSPGSSTTTVTVPSTSSTSTTTTSISVAPPTPPQRTPLWQRLVEFLLAIIGVKQ